MWVGSQVINAIVAIAFFAAVSFLALELYRRQRHSASHQLRRRRCAEPEEKSQHRFKRVLANNSYSPFKHFKREGQDKEVSLKTHPFSVEINSLLEHPPDHASFFTNHKCPDISTSYVWINTELELELLEKQLSKEKVFAVDTEQHSLRSFLGFTALMQISTQEEDYLIDTIVLHDMMGILRAVFSNPSICKVFHGSDNDVLWLQRDFHIYVVNMFDTAKACDILLKPQRSLAYLLETYCDVSTNKTLQREDWRIRPLSADMIEYACTDAHYLLYIAYCLACELEAKSLASPDDKVNFFFEASRRSNMICLQIYAKEVESFPGASAAASLLSRCLNNDGGLSWKSGESKDRILMLCAWRDLMARLHDESLRYILSDQAIIDLSLKVPKNPNEAHDIILQADLCGVSSNTYMTSQSATSVVNNHLEELCDILQQDSADMNDIFKRILQLHLGPDGCTPLSAYNYALLSEFSLQKISTSFLKQNVENLARTTGKKASRELFVQKFSCKAPVYHNCRIYASDGRLLCFCDRKKLEWYLKRDLAKLVENDPPAIMLLFEPKGRPEDEDNEFYISSKKNICVGCGEKNHYLRYRIIPSCYRMHFPEHLKSHRSHDIVLLCVDCHEIAHSAAEKHKRQIAKEFRIPLFVQKIVNSGKSTIATVGSHSTGEMEEAGVSPLQLRAAAMALLCHGSNMPSERVEELMQTLRTYFGRQEIIAEDMETAFLVGMSPQERRRLEKKRGLLFRQNEQIIIYKNGSCGAVKPYENNINQNDAMREPSQDNSKNNVNSRQTTSDGMGLLVDDNGLDAAADGSIHKLENKANGDVDPSDKADEDEIPLLSHEVSSSKGSKRTSLLGHGPHGKQVVEQLLSKYGEDGIRQFCEKWRQIFVESINPRFLPSGWDIMHSGRREFGDYSVYNPVNQGNTGVIV